MSRCSSASQLISFIKSNQRIFVHGSAATPTIILQAMLDEFERFKNIEFIHLHTEGLGEYANEKYVDHFRVASLFNGKNLRDKLNFRNVDYIPCFLSEIPNIFRSKKRPLDVALIQVSPPDDQGLCSLGTSVDVALAAVESAQLILAQVNIQMPRVHGDGIIHFDKINHYIEINEPLPQAPLHRPTHEEILIGKNVAQLIDDGSCLQVGIGSIPDAVVAELTNHRHLGLHSEMWSDGVLNLIQNGTVDNSGKQIHAGKNISSFVFGSQKLYDFIHNNSDVMQLGADIVNNPNVIAKNKNVMAINSAVEIDLTGQICSDSVGHKIISGFGGQVDFMRGATLSEGGKPIIAMTSRTKKKKSKIVFELTSGAGVVTTRAQTHFVVTEYGIADLYGKTLSERAKSLIEIAHPDDRESLQKKWFSLC